MSNRMNLVVANVLVMASAAVAAPQSVQDYVPANTCPDMWPIYSTAQPSEKSPPYNITVTPTSVNGGGIVRVHVSGDEKFRGIYLLAKRGQQNVGEFLLPSGSSRSPTVIDCLPGYKKAVSYISRTPLEPLEIDWKAPNYDAEIFFRATIVKTLSEYWLGVESPKITVNERVETANEETVTATENAIAA